ncbi:hypothetical protein EWM64_g8686 [Hericium alpestre]|uniref:AMP-dependent synthetase/ligase domain-containing protein n=1 Tax=Hericium alpestre TaxID=135208 RepID=A0A4Y9ZM19_9AGAM|nr:hypothetical protein EWM64_g8686 [Hericium alpestre]
MNWKSLYPPIPDVPTVNFHDFLFERPAVRDQEDYTAFIDGPSGDRITFRQVKERVADAATALDGIGLKNGQDIVGILSENSIEFPILILALLKLAVPFSLLPAYATEAEVSTLVKLSKATYIFASAKLYLLALRIAKERGTPADRIFTFGGQVNGVQSLAELIDDVRTRKPPRVPSHPVQDKTPAYLAFSSGTSGLPKGSYDCQFPLMKEANSLPGVMISHRNLYYSGMQPMIVALTVSKVFMPPALNTPEGIPITLAAAPFYHAMGMHNGILRLLAQPGTAIIIPKWDVNLAFDMIKKYSPTNMTIVPSMIYQMVTSPRWETEDLSKLLSMGSGAAYLPPELRKKLLKGTPNVGYFYIGYGMSECTLAAILTPFPLLFDGRFNNRPNMTGILLPGIEARIVRDDGTLAAPGEPGELQVKSGTVGLGYWENEKATREAFLEDGWLRTGDRFSADADGAF